MVVNVPSEFHRKELADLFACVGFAEILEYLIGLLAFVYILPYGIIIVLLRALQCGFGSLDDLKTDAACLDLADIVLMLHVVANIDGRGLYFACCEGVDDLLLEIVCTHDHFV